MENFIGQFISAWGPFGVGLLMFIETVFPPLPSEIIMPLAGIAAAQGNYSLASVILAGTIGALLGNLFWFALAWKLGLDRFESLLIRYGRFLTLDRQELERGRRLFAEHGGPIVGVGRVLPTVRSLISVPAGLMRMNLRQFLLWSAAGTFLWTMGLAVAGYWLGRELDAIDRVIGPLSTAVLVSIFLVYLWRVLTWDRRHRQP
jgi:membrane protein DedA with SNARE-associated domain